MRLAEGSAVDGRMTERLLCLTVNQIREEGWFDSNSFQRGGSSERIGQRRRESGWGGKRERWEWE